MKKKYFVKKKIIYGNNNLLNIFHCLTVSHCERNELSDSVGFGTNLAQIKSEIHPMQKIFKVLIVPHEIIVNAEITQGTVITRTLLYFIIPGQIDPKRTFKLNSV